MLRPLNQRHALVQVFRGHIQYAFVAGCRHDASLFDNDDHWVRFIERMPFAGFAAAFDGDILAALDDTRDVRTSGSGFEQCLLAGSFRHRPSRLPNCRDSLHTRQNFLNSASSQTLKISPGLY